MTVLRQYHETLGSSSAFSKVRSNASPGTDSWSSSMILFHVRMRPLRNAMGAAMQSDVAGLSRTGATGYLRLHLGIAQGYATLGRVGFEGRFDYAAIGTVTNLAAAFAGTRGSREIRVSQRVYMPRRSTSSCPMK